MKLVAALLTLVLNLIPSVAFAEDCPLMTTFPFSEVRSLHPLGLIYPGGSHVFPEARVYVALNGDGGSPVQQQVIDVVAPASILITSVQRVFYADRGGDAVYGVRFSIDDKNCDGLSFFIGQIEDLDSAVSSALSTWPSGCSYSSSTTVSCFQSVSVSMGEGDPMGWAGGGTGTGGANNTHAIEFIAYDQDNPQNFVVPSHYNPASPNSFLYARCPLDYFDSSIVSSYSNMWGISDLATGNFYVTRTASPVCGELSYDPVSPASFAQGNWFLETSSFPGDAFNASKHVSLGKDPITPSIPIIASGAWNDAFTFSPVNTTGLVNLRLDLLVPSAYYCYENLSQYQGGGGSSVSGRIILKVSSETTISIDRQPGATDCSLGPSDWNFTSNAKEYIR